MPRRSITVTFLTGNKNKVEEAQKILGNKFRNTYIF